MEYAEPGSHSGAQIKRMQAGGSDSHGTYFYCYSSSRSVTPVPHGLCSQWSLASASPDGSVWYAGIRQKWMTAAQHPQSGVAWAVMRPNPPRRQNVLLFTLLGLRWLDHRQWQLGYPIGLGLWRDKIGKLVTKLSWRQICGWTSGTKPQIWKLSYPCINKYPPDVCTAEEALSLDGLDNPSLDVSQPLPPATLLLTQWSEISVIASTTQAAEECQVFDAIPWEVQACEADMNGTESGQPEPAEPSPNWLNYQPTHRPVSKK